jgi:S1-C subfamily serine protease
VEEIEMSALIDFSNELAAIAERVGQSVVTVHGGRRRPSSGVHWRKGVVVTSEHGLRGAQEITVTAAGEKEFTAALAGRDPSTDLAVLRMEGLAAPVAELGDSAQLKLGHFVLALGRSWRGNVVASAGAVGAASGPWRTWRGGQIEQHLRLALELYSGMSGGPLVDAGGHIVGINTSGLAPGRAVALPVVAVNRVIDELLEKGHIARPYLGLSMAPVPLPEKLREVVGANISTGLLVMHVESDSPAGKAGIALGDVLIQLQGKYVADTVAVREALGGARIGDSVRAKVLRGGALSEQSITLGERPGR